MLGSETSPRCKSGGRDEEMLKGLHGCLARGDAERPTSSVIDATEPGKLGAVAFGLASKRRQ